MNLQFSKKEMMILIFGAVIVILLYWLLSATYLQPLQDKVIQKEQLLKTEKQIQAAYEKRMTAGPSGEIKSVAELYKIIPKEPFTEQLILNFEKAEVVSDSTITLMKFGESSSSPDQKIAAVSNLPSTDSKSTNGIKKVPDSLPTGLQKTFVTLSVEAKGYQGLEKFIQALEESKREITIETIDFEGPKKADYVTNSKEILLSTITVSAFYLPVENDKGDRMEIETPAPANKRNPFPTFDGSNGNLLEKDQSADGAGKAAQ